MKKSVLAVVASISLVIPGLSFVPKVQAQEEMQTLIIKNNKTEISKIESLGGKLLYTFKNANVVEVELPKSNLTSILKDTGVQNLEPSQTIKYNSQVVDYGMTNVNAVKSWGDGYTGKNVKIAVIDSGVTTHEDLNIKERVSFLTPDETMGMNVPEDLIGHGTHVAGIIGAQDNNLGVKGVASNSDIYSLQIGSMPDIARAIDWAISNHMDIVNMSIGWSVEDPIIKELLEKANENGILVVVAAGNDGEASGTANNVDFPAKYESVISVGATDNQNKRAYFSSTGKVDITAPGVNVYSTFPKELGSKYMYMSGTSMASPYAVGVLALYKEAYPSFSGSQIRALMEQNALDLGPIGKDMMYGYGLIQAPDHQTVTFPDVTSIPQDFKVESQNGYEVSLSWHPTIDATSYQLYRDDQLVYSGTGNVYGDNSVTDGNHTYKLMANSSKGDSSPVSLTISVNSSNGQPLMLDYTNVVAGDTIATISWEQGLNIDKYVLMRDGKTLYEGKDLSFTDNNLNPSQEYIYVLYAQNANGTTLPQYITVDTLAPLLTTKVSNVKAVATKRGVQLSWDKKDWSDMYVVEKNGEVIYTSDINSFLDKKAIDGKTYSYHIYAFNTRGNSPKFTVSVKSLNVSPATKYKKTFTSISLNKTSFHSGEKIVITSTVRNEGKHTISGSDETILIKDASGHVIFTKVEKTNANGVVKVSYIFKKSNAKGHYEVIVQTKDAHLAGSTGVVKINKK